MNLRNLVPALALAAVTAAPAMAADAVPAVSFSGWVDTILAISDDDTDDTIGGKDDESATIRFTSQASIKANWKVTDALTAKINLWFDPGSDGLNMREAYFAWAINDTVTWSMGKYIDHIGWLSAEPTGLYTVNDSLIGYLDAYGNDVIGTSIGVAPKDSPISGSFHIVNGYFTGSDALNGDPSTERENTDLGFGLDLIYELPNDMGSLNLEFAYDMSSGQPDPTGYSLGNAPAGGIGGDVFLVGFNATVKPVKPLMIGAEIQYLAIGESETAGGTEVVDSDISRIQGMLLANYAIEGASIPMSVTGQLQYITIDNNSADDETRFGLAVALLTNPLGSSNFGLNFEVGFYDVSDFGGTTPPTPAVDDNGFVLAMEGLVTF